MEQRVSSADAGSPALDALTGQSSAAARLVDRVLGRVPDDPGFATLRRATRAALVITAAFAFAKLVIGDVQVTTFVVFGCFALLVMADFGGPRRPRAAAYIATTIAGAILVTLGTLASPVAWVAALVMLLIGFSIQFAGVFGGYVAAAQTCLLLSFVLAVSVPGPASSIGARLAGWCLAGVVSTLSGVFFWPLFERVGLRDKAGKACIALAQLVAAQRNQEDGETHRRLEAARAAVGEVRRLYTATPKRPAGPTRRDRAFVELLNELERTLKFTALPFGLQPPASHPCIGEGNALADTVVQTFEGSAAVLTGGKSPDLQRLNETRQAHRTALDRWAADALHDGATPEQVLAGLDADHALRIYSYLALVAGSNAIITAGGELNDGIDLPVGTPRQGLAMPAIRIARTVRIHLVWTSGILHHALRVGVGLALAVLLARLLRLDHAFWVTLGTLSVLRSNAFGTGRTTVEALLGTIIGFGIGALFTVVAGASSPALWIALPILVFLATYTSNTIGFVAGQAAFTVLVIVLFNLISPLGWRVGLARIEDIGVGVGVSILAGLLLWPRGARGDLGAAIAESYRAVARYLAGAFTALLTPETPESTASARRLATEAHYRAEEVFEQFLNERGAKPLDPATGSRLLLAGTHLILVGDLLDSIVGMGYRAGSDVPEVTAVRNQAQLMLSSLLRLADRLEGTPSALVAGSGVSDDALRAAALSAIRRWRDDPSEGSAALAIVMAGEWIQQLGELAAYLEPPVAKAVEVARVPWWR